MINHWLIGAAAGDRNLASAPAVMTHYDGCGGPGRRPAAHDVNDDDTDVNKTFRLGFDTRAYLPGRFPTTIGPLLIIVPS